MTKDKKLVKIGKFFHQCSNSEYIELLHYALGNLYDRTMSALSELDEKDLDFLIAKFNLDKEKYG